MKSAEQNNAFLNRLAKELPESNATIRGKWAREIIDENKNIKKLAPLLDEHKTIAMRFAWLLTEMAEKNSAKLFNELPFLWNKSQKIQHFDFKQSFAGYWRICGVPEENEAEAIDQLFYWLQSASTNITIKSRALFVLADLIKKYPDLKNEFKICVESQMNLHSKDFEKRAQKIIQNLP